MPYSIEGRCWRWAAVLALALTAASCEEDGTGPRQDLVGTLTVDASSAELWSHVSLAETTAQKVVVTDAVTSTAWDIAFRTTAVKLNGGPNGPAGIVAYCICKNTNASTDEMKAMTADSELADFQEVTEASIPPATDPLWVNTTFDAKRWYRYNITGADNQIWPTFDVYLIKRGAQVYKLQITGYYDAAGTPRHVSFRFARLTG